MVFSLGTFQSSFTSLDYNLVQYKMWQETYGTRISICINIGRGVIQISQSASLWCNTSMGFTFYFMEMYVSPSAATLKAFEVVEMSFHH